MPDFPRPTAMSGGRRRLHYLGKSIFAVALTAVIALGAFVGDRLGLFGRAPVPDWDKYEGKTFHVVYVVDGDTLDVDCPDGKFRHTRVRLLGVDTPETVKPDTPVQHFGPEASAYTKRLAMGKTVALKLDRARTRDNYNRLLAYVLLPDGKCLNQLLVATGFGYADPRFAHPWRDQYKHLQTAAMKAQLGLWKGITRDELPYYYREGPDSLKLPGPAPTRPVPKLTPTPSHRTRTSSRAQAAGAAPLAA